MQTNIHFWKYVAEFFLEWDVAENICRENQNTHVMFSNIFFRKSCRLWDKAEKYSRVGQATDDMVHAHARGVLDTLRLQTHSPEMYSNYCFFAPPIIVWF
jgi:hypothetical protein